MLQFVRWLACAMTVILSARLPLAAAVPVEPGSREFHEQLWPVAFGCPYVEGQSSITLGDEVAPGIRTVLLFDHPTWASTGEMIHVGFFTQDASFPVSWLPSEQHKLDTTGQAIELTGTMFSSFTAVSGSLQTSTGFVSYLSALVDSTTLTLDAPAGPLSVKCCVFGGVVGAIMHKAQCRARAHNAYATAVAICKSNFISCMAGCGIIISEW